MASMIRCCVVTSRVTFVPDNYDRVILPLAESPYVQALLVVDNLDWKLLKQVTGVAVLGARRISAKLLVNALGGSMTRRRRAFQSMGKGFGTVEDVNSSETVQFLRDNSINVVVNMRTRDIYREPLLELPELGCYNVHHGVLPEQRGTLCDLWALYEGVGAGFSIHRMTRRIDDGPIVKRCIVNKRSATTFFEYLVEAGQHEVRTVAQFLEEMAQQQVTLQRNECSDAVYRSTPGRDVLRNMKKKGLGV